MKEVYRLQRHPLKEKLHKEGLNVIGLLLFVAKEDKFSFDELNTSFLRLLHQLESAIFSER